MKIYCCVYFLIFIFLIISSCSDRNSGDKSPEILVASDVLDSNYHKKNFDSLIITIDRETASNLDRSEEFLGNGNFLSIYDHSAFYLEDAINFISNDSLTGRRPFICILAMQNLPVKDYVRFCNALAELYEENKIKESLLKNAIMPNFLDKRIIIMNYNNASVVKLLERIRNNKEITREFKDDIEDILLGKL